MQLTEFVFVSRVCKGRSGKILTSQPIIYIFGELYELVTENEIDPHEAIYLSLYVSLHLYFSPSPSLSVSIRLKSTFVDDLQSHLFVIYLIILKPLAA